MKLKRQFRTVVADDLEIRADEGGGSFEFSFSSEAAVERYFGMEVLSHESGAMNLDRVRAKAAPLLWNHDPDQPIGMIESAEVRNGKGHARAKFFSTPFAQEKRKQVEEGLRNISFGYQIDDIDRVREASNDTPAEWLVKQYSVFEISVVSVPADFKVGVGRADMNEEIEVKNTKPLKGERKSMDEKELAAKAAREEADRKAVVQVREEATKLERERMSSIDALGKQFKKEDLARQLIEGGKTIEQAREAFLQAIATKQTAISEAGGENDLGLSKKEVQEFSFIRAINALANPTDRHAQEAAKFEREVSEAAAKARGKASRGIFVPYEILRAQRDLSKGTASAGGHTVGTELKADAFIELLRKKSALNRAGARILNGLVGDIAIPKQTGGATAYWVAEGSAPTESQQTFGQVAMSPKTVGAYTDVSRKLLIQSSLDIESLIRGDLAAVVALAIDLKGLYGTGASNEPLGVTQVSGINVEDFAAATPTYAELIAMESRIAADDADAEGMKYLVNALMRGHCKSTEKFSSTGQVIWEPGNSINGYGAVVSNQLTDGDVIFGNWNDLMIGFWSGLDLMVDPYALATSGGVRVIALQDVDVAVRHAESFCFGNDDQTE